MMIIEFISIVMIIQCTHLVVVLIQRMGLKCSVIGFLAVHVSKVVFA